MWKNGITRHASECTVSSCDIQSIWHHHGTLTPPTYECFNNLTTQPLTFITNHSPLLDHGDNPRGIFFLSLLYFIYFFGILF